MQPATLTCTIPPASCSSSTLCCTWRQVWPCSQGCTPRDRSTNCSALSSSQTRDFDLHRSASALHWWPSSATSLVWASGCRRWSSGSAVRESTSIGCWCYSVQGWYSCDFKPSGTQCWHWGLFWFWCAGSPAYASTCGRTCGHATRDTTSLSTNRSSCLWLAAQLMSRDCMMMSRDHIMMSRDTLNRPLRITWSSLNCHLVTWH